MEDLDWIAQHPYILTACVVLIILVFVRLFRLYWTSGGRIGMIKKSDKARSRDSGWGDGGVGIGEDGDDGGEGN